MPPTRLDNIYAELLSLSTPSQQPPNFDKLAALFSPNCTTNFRSMREATLTGREALVADMKDYRSTWQLLERRVLAQTSTAMVPLGGGKEEKQEVVEFCQMENKLAIVSQVLEAFPETVVARFGPDGLCTDFKVYCCRSPQVRIVQERTGRGPYSCQEMDREEGA